MVVLANDGISWGRAWRWASLAHPASAVRHAGVSTNRIQTFTCCWLLGRQRWALVVAYTCWSLPTCLQYWQPQTSIDSHRHLWSANHGQRQVPRIRMSTCGRRAFGHAGPSTWNALSNILKCSTHSLSTFRRHLKRLLFVLLAQWACSRLLQLTHYKNNFLTYFSMIMIGISWYDERSATSCSDLYRRHGWSQKPSSGKRSEFYRESRWNLGCTIPGELLECCVKRSWCLELIMQMRVLYVTLSFFLVFVSVKVQTPRHVPKTEVSIG